jgi:hypothetical protein
MMTDRKWRASPIESSGFSDINVPHYDPQMSGLRRHQPAGMRKQRSYGDGLASGQYRPVWSPRK